MKHLLQIAMLLCLGMLISCSSIKVQSDVSDGAEFSGVTTYSWIGWQDNVGARLSEIEKTRLKEAFEAEIAKRGLSQVDSDGDLEISLYLVASQETATTAYTNYYGGYGGRYRGYRGGWGAGYSSTHYVQEDYVKGTLVMDVFGGAENDLYWQSVGSGTIKDNPQKREKNFPTIAAKMMKDFPISPSE